ncbi:unnamed protein product [Auanema sp. JU1783]|nr:unnamed protein product [Auanema sp. JU1783]
MDKNLEEDADISKTYERWVSTRPKPYFSFSINPRGWIYWWWTCIVSIACSYNLIFTTLIVYEEIQDHFYLYWILGNIVSDVIFILDMIALSLLNFYENGCEIVDWGSTKINYIESWKFLVDSAAILPTDLLLFTAPHFSLLRINRFLKIYRFAELFEMAEQKLPRGIVSIFKVIGICTIMFHWNACGFYILSLISNENSKDISNATFDDDTLWPWPYLPQKVTNFYYPTCSHFARTCDYSVFYTDEEREAHFWDLYDIWKNQSLFITFSDFTKKYSVSIYWSALTMTTLGEQPSPNETYQTAFEIFDTVIGIVIFAAIMGSVGDLVQNSNKVETEWRQLMDGLKQYMDYRHLDVDLQKRILMYCEYEMNKKELMKELEIKTNLPVKLHSKLNSGLHWNTLAKTDFFKDIEVPFLQDLMSYAVPMDYGPGDVIFTVGDINKEMYIVLSGELSYLDLQTSTRSHFTHLDVIGERQLVWFENHKLGNRRGGILSSEEYSEVLILSRADFNLVLEDYPCLRKLFIKRAFDLQSRFVELRNETFQLANATDGLRLEDKLDYIKKQMENFERDVNRQIKRFINSSRDMKTRLYKLENNFPGKHRRKKI